MIASFPFIASSMDSDARAFCQVSGAQDRAAINFFVKGIKNLGLYNDMVCWPLRSAQNAGTGSTAYSLGGLGTYDGTLVNGPTWGVDGIAIDGIDDYVDLSIIPSTVNNASLYLVHKPTIDENVNILGCRSSATPLQGFEAGRRGATSGNRRGEFTSRYGESLVQAIISGAETLNDFHSYAYLHDATNKKAGCMVDTFSTWTLSSAAPTAFGATDRSLKLATEGGTNASGGSTGTYSMLIHFEGLAVPESQIGSIHSLYKSTLGQGLGLP
jgi:hypothetical protein